MCKLKETLKKLCTMRGVSGFEFMLNEAVADMFRPYTDEVTINNAGSVIAVKRAKNPTAKIMVEAHCDEIGLMVKNIDEKGFLTFVNIGGVDARILPGAEVTVHGKRNVLGVIGAKPPHLQTADEAEKSISITDMAIDVGMSADAVHEIISVGDSISLNREPTELLNNNFSAKTVDDRGGVAALIEAAKRLKDEELSCDVYFVAAVQEEVGLRGARTASYGVNPDMAVAIDVCHGITPDNSYNAFETGTGTVISLGPNIHPKMGARLIELAKEKNIKYSIDVDGGDTGTDAWEIQVSRMGVPTALLSVPLKYMHTSVETLSIDDLEATASLITEFLKDTKEAKWLCF